MHDEHFVVLRGVELRTSIALAHAFVLKQPADFFASRAPSDYRALLRPLEFIVAGEA